MKLRLQRAIALVGWNLIAPIGEPARPGVLAPNTPLSEWRNLGTFDSSTQCEKALASLRASFEQDPRKEVMVWREQRDDSRDRALRAAAAQSVAERSLCVTSGDPRLKKTLRERQNYYTPAAAPSAVPNAPSNNRQRVSMPALPATTSAAPPAELPTRIIPEVRTQKGRNYAPAAPSVTHNASVNRQRVSMPALPATTNALPPVTVGTSRHVRSALGAPATSVRSRPGPFVTPPHGAALVKPVMIASFGNLTFWRLTSGGVIARSSDGAHWRPLNSGTTSDLFAGAAPSAEICWVVGSSGTVLRTTDGEQWQTIKSPTDADLVDVAARDELSATVFAADGRQFSTRDGGLSWRLSDSAQARIGGTM